MWSNYKARPEYAASEIAVWWDMNDCPVPDGYNAGRVCPSIEGALKNLGYNGPVTINAYGDLTQTPEQVLGGLSSTGVTVQHTAKELRCSYMYFDLMEWREHIPPHATIMLISDQVQDVFSFALCREQQKKFRKSRKDYEDPEDVQKRATAKKDSRPLLFKFNEGFTNVVKRPVRMREFLP